MILRPILLALALVAGLAGVTACGAKAGSGSVDYSVSAQKNYEKGLKELDSKDWVAASKYFAFIKSRFPYSKYAVLAELRLSDAEFGAEQYLEAIDSYRLFMKFHPTHEMVANGYASFKIGDAVPELGGDGGAAEPPGTGAEVPPPPLRPERPLRASPAALSSRQVQVPAVPHRGPASTARVSGGGGGSIEIWVWGELHAAAVAATRT